MRTCPRHAQAAQIVPIVLRVNSLRRLPQSLPPSAQVSEPQQPQQSPTRRASPESGVAGLCQDRGPGRDLISRPVARQGVRHAACLPPAALRPPRACAMSVILVVSERIPPGPPLSVHICVVSACVLVCAKAKYLNLIRAPGMNRVQHQQRRHMHSMPGK